MKHCPACSETKHWDEFNRNSARYDGLQSICKTCQAARRIERRERDAIRKAEYRRENAGRIRAKEAEYRRAHRESEYRRQAEWRAANPDMAKAQDARRGAARRARRSNAPEVEGGVTWRTVAERDGMKCHYCDTLTVQGHEDRRLWPTLDHIVSLATGGPHTLANAVLACHSCNSSKKDAPLEEWNPPKRGRE